ncbi:archease [Muriicola marianensis]|uniref:Archease n=1 Tax=Muriicola marianensis TaxID=1324801 RepID=A0ABQ1QQE2_9FLAO|nr:archease [Muriicola marianensis]GGD40709.1 archease [Muriicola marianensis]
MWIEYLPHTADIRMKIRGKTLETLFRNGIIGMGHILKEGFCEKRMSSDLSLKIHVESSDTTCLLVDFLSEVLSASYTEKSIFCKVDFLTLDSSEILAEIHGMRVEVFEEEIKAVTYHEADVHKCEGLWESVVVFDI